MANPYGVGTNDPAEARRRLKNRNTKEELYAIAQREIGSAAKKSWTKATLAQAIVEARGRSSRGIAPDWDLEDDL